MIQSFECNSVLVQKYKSCKIKLPLTKVKALLSHFLPKPNTQIGVYTKL